jgi:hypothetical protein
LIKTLVFEKSANFLPKIVENCDHNINPSTTITDAEKKRTEADVVKASAVTDKLAGDMADAVDMARTAVIAETVVIEGHEEDEDDIDDVEEVDEVDDVEEVEEIDDVEPEDEVADYLQNIFAEKN